MIQSGFVHLGVDTEGWNLHAGSDRRDFTSADIPFSRPFGSPPTVVVALSGIDSEHSTNLRVFADAADVESNEFNIHLFTWGDTLVYSVLLSWIAYDSYR
jgi:hypothetical protein